jgi:mannose/cellobiose epimerase-like protein (N-acyl-D-glucosamine 2-epimerase family)
MPLNRLKTYFIDTILPFWLSAAFDDQSGQFVEGLQLDGSQEPTGVVRIRTAARQIYVYAHAAALGVALDGALEKAERAFANLRKIAWIAGDRPGYARAINHKTGVVTDPERDLYDHACVLLALAWLIKATGKDAYRDHLAETVAAMDVTLAAPAGGWAEDARGSLPRRQNPHMHYFESCLALWETGCGTRYAARAGELFGLFRSRLFDDGIGALREFFGPTWEVSDQYQSAKLEPGHMVEWVWLVKRYEELTGENHAPIRAKLLDAALRLGKDRNSPFLVDEAGLDGKPLKQSRRLWPQAELLKAHLMQGYSGDKQHFGKAEALTETLFSTYLTETQPGTWRDCFDLDGGFIATSIPGSSLYHLWSGVAELVVRERL